MNIRSLYTTGSEQRFSAWLKLQDHKIMDRHPGHTITISREYGCEGYPLAERLLELLNERTRRTWTIFDKHLLEKVSNEAGISKLFLEHLGDASRIVDPLSGFLSKHTTHSEAYNFLIKKILQISQHGDAIIVGQGGAIITKHLKNCSHFRLEAPEEYRVSSISRRMNLKKEDAVKMVKENQTWREKFIEDMLGCHIQDSTNYDAVFNNAKSSVDEIAEAIYALCLPHFRMKNLLM